MSTTPNTPGSWQGEDVPAWRDGWKARGAAAEAERDALREQVARVEALADKWADDAPPRRTDQAHATLDCERDLRAALHPAPTTKAGDEG